MGRLTLNVLLSFAQFEREVIGERVLGQNRRLQAQGHLLADLCLGYRGADKKVVVVPEETANSHPLYPLS